MSATVYMRPDRSGDAPIVVERWRNEMTLFVISAIISVFAWFFLAISIVGLIYAVFIALFFFIIHLGFIAHVRGSGVRLGPDQFPELHARVEQLARRMGMKQAPEAYLMQAGGALNAFATRFARSHLIVLYSDLLEACGEDESARDMIIAHELGHIHAGHLNWRMLTLPASFVPFLGHALSRAREYTCDRYGLAGAGNADGATRGLAILAAGKVHGPKLNRAALVRQRSDINTGWMTLGSWLSTHPPLSKRLAMLDPSLEEGVKLPATGAKRAVGIIAAIYFAPAIVVMALMATTFGKSFREAMEQAQVQAEAQNAASVEGGPAGEYAMRDPAEVEAAVAKARRDVARLAGMLEGERAAGRPLPWDWQGRQELWTERNPAQPYPLDPFDSSTYGYARDGDDYRLWSTGPDVESYTDDDIVWDSKEKRGGR